MRIEDVPRMELRSGTAPGRLMAATPAPMRRSRRRSPPWPAQLARRIRDRQPQRDAQIRVLAPPRWSPLAAFAQLGAFAAHWDLLVVLSRHRINVRYKQSLLGGLWALLQPLAMMLVYTAVFSRLVKVPSEGVPYALFAYAGILPWTFFTAAVSNGTGSLVTHAQLVTKVYFPREILPISYVACAAVDLLIGSSALLALLLFFHVRIGWAAFAVVPIAAIFGAFALACALMLSTLQVRFRDVGVALPVVLQLWMFASPVLYPLRVVPAAWRPLYLLNPAAGLVDAFRRVVLGIPLDAGALRIAALVTAVVLPLAYVAFKHVEATVADVI
jgi:lipopolysaccharide transport system permease protein